MHRPVLFALFLALAACNDAADDAQTFDAERPWRKPGDVIDSILPMEEYLRRFREGVPEVTAMTGGESDPTSLARRFVTLLASRDSVALDSLRLTRAEFAWLLFPDHAYMREPYELDPALFWSQIGAGSDQGLRRALTRVGGQPLTFVSVACQADTLQLVQGPAKIWSQCQLRYRAGDSIVAGRLFGSIVERDGRAKFLGYANDY